MDTKQLRADTYGILKALLMPLVVLAHITVMYTADGAFHCVRSSNLLTALTTYIYSFHMPAFFMISGCVYGWGVRAGKYRRAGSFLLKKTKRLLVPYVIFGFFCVVPVVYLCGLSPLTVPQAWLRDIVLAIQPRHLWYVFVLFEIFLVTVPLREMCKKHPGIVMLVSLAVFAVTLWVVFPTKENYLQYKNFPKYQVYFFFGVLLDRIFDTLREWTLCLKWLWILLPIAQGSWLILAGSMPYLKVCFGLLGCVWVLCGGILLCEYLPRLCGSRFMKSLGDCGYGIYLLHPMIIYGIFYFARSWTIHPLLLTAVVFVTVLAVSWLLTVFWHTLVQRVRKKG